MFRNYLVTAFRNLTKNKLYSVINILGLSIGLCAFILIFLYVQNETSYDAFIPDSDNIYRVEGAMIFPGRPPMESVAIQAPAKETFLGDYSSDVTDGTRIFRNPENINHDNVVIGETFNYVDANFLEFFKIPLIEGDPKTALNDLSSVVISASYARKYFGETDPLGRTLKLESGRIYKVSGVFQDLPENSHFDLNIIAVFDTSLFPNLMPFIDNWYGWGFYTYLKIPSKTAAARVEKDFAAYVDKNVAVQYGGYENAKTSDIIKFKLTKITDIHLHSSSSGAMKQQGNPVTVVIFISVAILIILIANINYINLSTARSVLRVREIGVRKVVGANKRQLVSQFLGESLVTVGIAVLFSLGLAQFILPAFARLMDVSLFLDIFSNGQLGLVILATFVFIGLVGGLYPAFYLSRLKPSQIMNANQSAHPGGNWIRQILVVAQFSISIALITSALIVYAQLYFAKTLDLGFAKKGVLVLDDAIAGQPENVKRTLRAELEKIPGVEGVSLSNSSPFEGGGFHVITQPPLGGDTIIVNGYSISDSFIPTLKIPVLIGRNLSENFASDTFVGVNNRDENSPKEFSVIANQSLLSLYGLPQGPEVLGTTFKNGSGDTTYKIVGVIPDLNYETVREKVFPSFYFHSVGSLSDVIIRLNPGDFQRITNEILAVASRLIPDTEIKATPLEETLSRVYDPDEKRGRMFAIFAVLAIVIASSGLFSLASLVADQKTKEVGIRKVLGASVRNIINLLVWEFLRPVVLANLIAWPVGWYFMNDWLEGFAYRIDLNLYYFAGAGLFAVLVAIITVGGRAYQTANTNPIHALRYE